MTTIKHPDPTTKRNLTKLDYARLSTDQRKEWKTNVAIEQTISQLKEEQEDLLRKMKSLIKDHRRNCNVRLLVLDGELKLLNQAIPELFYMAICEEYAEGIDRLEDNIDKTKLFDFGKRVVFLSD